MNKLELLATLDAAIDQQEQVADLEQHLAKARGRLTVSAIRRSRGGVENQRQAMLEALLAAMDFIDAFPDLKPLTLPLSDLRDALIDSHRGMKSKQSDLLFTKEAGNKGLSEAEMDIRAFAVAALEALLEVGEREEDSETRVAREFSAAGVKMGRETARNLTASTLHNWRSNARGHGDDLYTRARVSGLRAAAVAAGRWPATVQAAKDFAHEIALIAASAKNVK